MSLKNKTIIVDAGHGGDHYGVTHDGVKEKNITLPIAQKLKSKLESEGAIVYMTRTDDNPPWIDTDINDRVNYINNRFRNNYHALVSIHLNRPLGRVGAFYQSGNSSSLASTIGFLYGQATYSGDYAILRDTLGSSIPKALVEVGRISYYKVTRDSWQEQQADNIFYGLRAFFM